MILLNISTSIRLRLLHMLALLFHYYHILQFHGQACKLFHGLRMTVPVLIETCADVCTVQDFHLPVRAKQPMVCNQLLPVV